MYEKLELKKINYFRENENVWKIRGYEKLEALQYIEFEVMVNVDSKVLFTCAVLDGSVV